MRSIDTKDLTTRARLRDAALALFAKQGFAATSTRAVAAEAGVSPGLVTHHFGSKEGLRQAVEDEVLRVFDDALADLEGVGDQETMLAALGALTARVFGEDPVLRGYLRHALLEDGSAGAGLFSRLLGGAQRELERLASLSGLRADADPLWAPYQVLFLILGPLLLEPVMQPALAQPVFAPETVEARSEANQRLLMHGLLTEGASPDEV